MWLLPALAQVSSIAARAFYRLAIVGEPIPAGGPVLLVANHPNSLFDPALVAVSAARPVRFLAKAPLFTDPAVGWLVRGSGAIPIYRASEDPTASARNTSAFRAVHMAFADGSAVGIFPEGTTHNHPSLVPLKTGAARMALGGARELGAAFPIIPVGLTFRDKERFRSEAIAVIGDPVFWGDLADAGEAAARELTRRIDAALRRVTINVEQWEDRPLLEAAEAIYAAEVAPNTNPARQVGRLHQAAQALAELRRAGPDPWQPLAAEVEEHWRMLAALRATPASLKSLPGWGTALRWALKKAGLWLLRGPLLLFGGSLFWIPYRTPGWITDSLNVGKELRATYKVLIGFVAFLVWITTLAVVLGWIFGAAVGLVAVIALPVLAAATLVLSDRWFDTVAIARRFLQLQRGGGVHERLRRRQREIALRLDALLSRASKPLPETR